MKNIRRILIVLGICIILIIAIIIIHIESYDLIELNPKEIENIILVDNHIGLTEDNAIDITGIQDINSICELFNKTAMKIIDYDKILHVYGGCSYTFLFNFSDGKVKEVTYNNGPYLYMDGNTYRIDSTEFESFWELKYPKIRYNRIT